MKKRTQRIALSATPATSAELRIRQKRGQVTYDALIDTAFALLAEREFDEISIAELAQKAGYSVGAFYARFKSKDELFDAMIVRHIEQRRAVRARQFATESDQSLVREIIQETVRYFWTRRRFWRAALIRSIGDSEFWEPIRSMSHELQDAFIARVTARAGRPLTKPEQTNVRFAVQLVLGTVNNTIINRPGPIFMGQASFVDGLVRAFNLVSGYTDALPAPPSSQLAKKRDEAR